MITLAVPADPRGAMRDQLAAAAGMDVVEFGVWEVIAWEVLDEDDAAT